MSRFVIAVTLLIFVALPAQAQKNKRTFVNARGLVCTEKSDDREGKEKYDLKCKTPKGKQLGKLDKRQNRRDCTNVARGSWCDVEVNDGRRVPSRLPDMMSVISYNQGRRTNDVMQWLGNESYRVRYSDVNRANRPRRATWFDNSGQTIQEWIDSNSDGRADSVRLFKNGWLLRVVGR
jgi:hypothetical protein